MHQPHLCARRHHRLVASSPVRRAVKKPMCQKKFWDSGSQEQMAQSVLPSWEKRCLLSSWKQDRGSY